MILCWSHCAAATLNAPLCNTFKLCDKYGDEKLRLVTALTSLLLSSSLSSSGSGIRTMRLLSTDIENAELKLVTFDNLDETPSYAILSHTWETDQEVLFTHIQSKDPSMRSLSGYAKIVGFCQTARQDGFEYVWVDTCCIDKTSSAELSEAINSMFKWYTRTHKCYVHLADVLEPTTSAIHGSNLGKSTALGVYNSAFRKSRWFTRGWTLQEMIAPEIVTFYTAQWQHISERDELAGTIEDITSIDADVLRGTSPMEYSIATRMAWAANRKTTRLEDKAYSLMGLFDVNMPTIYGEGDRAFTRLQYEIMALTPYHSLLAWNDIRSSDLRTSFLASSPEKFARSSNVVDVDPDEFSAFWDPHGEMKTLVKGPEGIRTRLPVFDVPNPANGHNDTVHAIAVIACRVVDPIFKRHHFIGLPLRSTNSTNRFSRASLAGFVNVDCLVDMRIPWSIKSIILADRVDTQPLLKKVPYHSLEIIIGAETLQSLERDTHFQLGQHESDRPGSFMLMGCQIHISWKGMVEYKTEMINEVLIGT